jgi:hypothetical protein
MGIVNLVAAVAVEVTGMNVASPSIDIDEGNA